jgi:hypothetical protein
MAAIGNSPTQQAFTPAIDYFSGTGSATAFTLSRPVASVAQVQAVVNNVAQNPSDAFTVSGNTITFTSAPSSGTNNIYVYYTSPITQVIAPGQGTVTTTSLTSGLTLTSPIVATTIGVGGATPSTSGAGITFPATASASTNANTLDDYEEGTFTITVTPTIGSLTSYTSAGIYVKVGQAVTVNFGFTIGTVGTAGGGAVFAGLPFQGAVAPVGNRLAIGMVRENAATGNVYQFYIDTNATTGLTLTLTNGAILWGNGYQYEYTITYQSAA